LLLQIMCVRSLMFDRDSGVWALVPARAAEARPLSDSVRDTATRVGAVTYLYRHLYVPLTLLVMDRVYVVACTFILSLGARSSCPSRVVAYAIVTALWQFVAVYLVQRFCQVAFFRFVQNGQRILCIAFTIAFALGTLHMGSSGPRTTTTLVLSVLQSVCGLLRFAGALPHEAVWTSVGIHGSLNHVQVGHVHDGAPSWLERHSLQAWRRMGMLAPLPASPSLDGLTPIPRAQVVSKSSSNSSQEDACVSTYVYI